VIPLRSFNEEYIIETMPSALTSVLKPFRSLYLQVLLAVMIGIAFGLWAPSSAEAMKPLGDGFIKLVKMLIGPIIFCTVVSGLAGMENLKKASRVGFRAILYFEVLTTVSLLIGIVAAHVIRPGDGMNVDLMSLRPGEISVYTSEAKTHSAVDFLLNLIPANPVDAFARGDILEILVFSILFGVALSHLGERGKQWLGLIEQLTAVFFRMIGYIMRLAPLGAFGAMAFTIGRYGTASLGPLAKLMGTFYLTCALFVFVVLGSVCRAVGISIWSLLVYIREELAIVLGTSSSETALPPLMRKLEELGCPKPVVGLVVPAGYAFNLDGTSIYLTLAALFVAQATNANLSLSHEFAILGILLISSKGAAGVTGSGFVTLAATLSAVPGIPVTGIVLILGIDRFMSEARALTNIVGNAVATIVVSHWEGQWDGTQAEAVLSRARK
jgi:aerobic C4-dicarboxylate transport protein